MTTIIERTFVLKVPTEAAWNQLSEIEEWPRWAPHITSVALTPAGPLSARSAGYFRFAGGLRSRFEITEFNEGVNWKWRGRALGLTIDYDHRSEPVDANHTRLTWIVSARGPRLAKRLFARAYTRRLDRAIPGLRPFLGGGVPSADRHGDTATSMTNEGGTRMSKRALKLLVAVATVAVAVSSFSSQATAARPRPRLVAYLADATGASVGTVWMVRMDDGKVRFSIAARGLAPGFHGYHVHTAGVCDPEAKDPAGTTVAFLSAGGHYNPDATQSHGAHAGDMPPLLVTGDGRAGLSFRTDRFRLRDLMDSDGSAIILHAGPDNLANIPATTPTGSERYHSHVDDIFGPDTATKATGDAGARFACGVIRLP